MTSHHTLGIGGIVGILTILFVFAVLIDLSHTGAIVQTRPAPSLSARLCPPGTTSVYRASPPLYPGGPLEQANVVCVRSDRPVEAEFNTFPELPEDEVYPFDRLRQDKLTRHYD